MSGVFELERLAEPAAVRGVEFTEVVMMTPVLSTEAFAALGAPNLVYVRPVSAAEILASVPSSQIQGFELSPDQTLYAVHRADGERLAEEVPRHDGEEGSCWEDIPGLPSQ